MNTDNIEEGGADGELSPVGVVPAERQSRKRHGLVYGLNDVPPWSTTILLGLQHFLTGFGGNVSTVYLLAPSLCIVYSPVTMAEIIGTLFVVNGLVTIMQTTAGVRLPIIQGTTFAFMVPTFAILNQRGECPPAPTGNSTVEAIKVAEDEWQSRIREIQGAIMVASCFQVLVGATGIVGVLMRFIGPLTVSATITLVGLGLHKAAATKAGLHWGISVLTMVAVALSSQYLSEVGIPVLTFSVKKKCHVTKFKLFKLFPVLLGIIFAWLVCLIFTVTDVFPDDPSAYGYAARTDTHGDVLEASAWFRFPYPGQWGAPTVSLASVIGMLSGVLASIVESIGDYYACARMSGAPPPPQHAVNRGILMEGIGCLLAGAWGSGNGTTSHSENIGVIGLTRVGSRTVVQAAGCIMIVVGVIGKVSALIITIPEPVVGGILCITFGVVTAVGISNLQFVDLNSSRNLFVLGFSVLMGLVVPYYIEENPDLLNTGSDVVDQTLTVILTTGMFIGGFLAVILDNTIPGTVEERGIKRWRQHFTGDQEVESEEEGEALELNHLATDVGGETTGMKGHRGAAEANGAQGGIDGDEGNEGEEGPMEWEPRPPAQFFESQCYDLPYVMGVIRRWTWCRYVPFSPTFRGFKCGRPGALCKRKP